jgi:O-antigen/teichoic acid export membrane protein
MLVSGATQLGLPAIVVRYLPVASGSARRLILLAYCMTTLVGVVIAGLAVMTVGQWSPSLRFLKSDPAWAATFIAGTVAWNIFTIQDSVLTALRRAGVVPLENATYSVAKIVLLVAFSAASFSVGILLSWVLPAGIAVVAITAYLFRVVLPRSPAAAALVLPRDRMVRAVKLSVGNYLGYMSFMASSAAIPVLVVNDLGPSSAATFYSAWTISMTLPLIAASLSTSLTVEGAANRTDTGKLLRHTVLGAYLLLVPVAIILIAAAPLLLKLYGSAYAADGTTVLRLLTAAAIPNVLVMTALSIARVRDRGAIIAVGQVTMAVVSIAVTKLLLPSQGIDAGGYAWLTAQVVGATMLFVTVMLPELRGRPQSENLV